MFGQLGNQKQKEEAMRKMFVGFFIFGIIGLWIAPPSFATSTSVDALIDKLVEKGILTEKEADSLELEIAGDEKMMREEGFQQGLPEWVKNAKLKGDFRARYQYERKQNDLDARTRGRIRYRLGLDTKVNDQIKVGLGIASGADDPRSTNQTFTDTFERPDVRMDLAYAEYTPLESVKLKLIGGIFSRSNYLWAPTDLLWDGDVNPQGGGLHWEQTFNSRWTPYLNTGVWVIDEVTSTTSDRVDPFLYYTQGGVKFKQGDWSSNIAGIYYAFNGLKGTCPDWSAATNTGITTSSSGSCSAGALRYDYDSAGVSADLALAAPFGLEVIPEVGIFGDLGKDAFVYFTPDSDRYGGKADVRSHEGILEYGLNKNVTLALDYYQSKRIKAAENPEQIIQADVNMKF